MLTECARRPPSATAPKALLPREHGSWAMLLLPLLVGLSAPGAQAAPAAALLALAVAGFLARVPAAELLSPAPAPRALIWLAACGAVSALALAVLLGGWSRWGLLAFGVPASAAFAWSLTAAGSKRDAFNEFVAAAVFSLGAPGAFYAATGRLPAEAWVLGGLCALHLFGPVFHVGAAMTAHRAFFEPSRSPAMKEAKDRSMLYHAAAFAAGCAVCALGPFSWLAALPFAAAAFKAARLWTRPAEKADFHRLGWTEAAHALAFVLLLLLAR